MTYLYCLAVYLVGIVPFAIVVGKALRRSADATFVPVEEDAP